jgi:colicin import membrane protein
MALRIDANRSATAFHIDDGAVLFPYSVDAQHAVSSHPLEWSNQPWTREDADLARAKLKERYEAEVADAKARHLPPPTPPAPPPPPLTAADQAALDEHNKAVEAAAARLKAYYEKKAEEDKIAAQVAADEAIVASLPPQPQPAPVHPNNLSPAQIRKRAAMDDDEKAASDKEAADRKAVADREAAAQKAAADKAQADKMAASNAKVTR